ncbi:hypothetical protein [Spirochaeta dissipatitropha]
MSLLLSILTTGTFAFGIEFEPIENLMSVEKLELPDGSRIVTRPAYSSVETGHQIERIRILEEISLGFVSVNGEELRCQFQIVRNDAGNLVRIIGKVEGGRFWIDFIPITEGNYYYEYALTNGLPFESTVPGDVSDILVYSGIARVVP